MPAVFQDDHINAWLDLTISDPRQLSELLKAPPEEFLDCDPVSRRVNSVKFDEPEYTENIDWAMRHCCKKIPRAKRLGLRSSCTRRCIVS
jgi:SOS response associated peptidase (SRAP)